MTREELRQRQRERRAKCVQAILDSRAKKKLIVAGAGTGKTYTFGRLIEQRKGGNNLAMTFIRKLVVDMDIALKGNAEVKTFPIARSITSAVVADPPDCFRIWRIGLKNRMNSGPFGFTSDDDSRFNGCAKIGVLFEISSIRERKRGRVLHLIFRTLASGGFAWCAMFAEYPWEQCIRLKFRFLAR